jgi:hypothetical protein
MARWTLCWLLLIVTATAGSYYGTNALVASRGPSLASETLALRPLGTLGTPTCTNAARALVAAGEGSAPDATDQQKAAWDSAVESVREACGTA